MLPLVFAGADDNTGFADGDKMLIKMTSSDSSKTLNITFSERVIVRRGVIIYESAPFGATLHCHVLDAQDNEVHSYAKELPLFGSHILNLDTGEESFVEPGYYMKIEIFNSSGTGDEDAAANFKVAGYLLIRRETTT